MQFDGRGQFHENEIDVAGDYVIKRWRSTLVGDVHELGAGDTFEQRSREMRRRTYSLRRIVDLARTRFHVIDKFLLSLGRKIRAYQQDIGDRGHDRHRYKLRGVKIQFLVE